MNFGNQMIFRGKAMIYRGKSMVFWIKSISKNEKSCHLMSDYFYPPPLIKILKKNTPLYKYETFYKFRNIFKNISRKDNLTQNKNSLFLIVQDSFNFGQ